MNHNITALEMLRRRVTLISISLTDITEEAGYKRYCDEKWNLLSHNKLFYCTGGERYYRLSDGSAFRLTARDALYIPHGSIPYMYTVGDAENTGYLIYGKLLDENAELYDVGTKPALLKQFEFPADAFDSFLERYRNDIYAGLTNLAFIMKIYHGLFGRLSLIEKETLEAGMKLILPALEYMQSHAYERYPLDALADMCNISRQYFHALFRRYMQMSPADYRNLLRIRRAEEMLENSDLTVEYISGRLGFYDTSHFYKMYNKFKTK